MAHIGCPDILGESRDHGGLTELHSPLSLCLDCWKAGTKSEEIAKSSRCCQAHTPARSYPLHHRGALPDTVCCFLTDFACSGKPNHRTRPKLVELSRVLEKNEGKREKEETGSNNNNNSNKE